MLESEQLGHVVSGLDTSEESVKSPLDGIIPKNFNDIILILAKDPKMRREMVEWVKREFGINIESYLEKFFGEMPDKKTPIDLLETPQRELVEDIVAYIDEDGYSVGQVSYMMKISRKKVSELYQDKDKYLKQLSDIAAKKAKEAREELLKTLPWYSRYIVKLGLVRI